MTTLNSNNNSISLSSSINHNFNHRLNNSNINNYFQNKGIYVYKIKPDKNKEYNNIQNKAKTILGKEPNSYREIKRRANSNYELENDINNENFNKNKKKEKYYNLINKYISSA